MGRVIEERARDGISFPWSKAYETKIDETSAANLAELLGESLGSENPKATALKPSNSVTITHRHNGVDHSIVMECGLTGKMKSRFQKLCQRHSEIFFKNPDCVPCLRRRDGTVIEETLGLREDAVLKFRPPIGLSTEQRKVLSQYISKKLKNGTLKKLEPQAWSSQVMLVPKNRKDEHGNQLWRFVQSHVDLNKNCKFRHFDMPKPRELLSRLPKNSRFFPM